MSAQAATVEKLSREQLQSASKAPEVIKTIRLGSANVTLKRWPSDGSFIIEIGQRDFKDSKKFHNVAFGVYETGAYSDAFNQLRAAAQRLDSND
jgi:hypothetical protein